MSPRKPKSMVCNVTVRPVVRRYRNKVYDYFEVDVTRRNFRRRSVFTSEKEALAWAEETKREAEQIGLVAQEMTMGQRQDAAAAFRILPPNMTLQDAVRYYLRGVETSKAMDIERAVALYLADKRMAGLAEFTLSTWRSRLNKLVDTFGERRVSSVGTAELSAWMQRWDKPGTRNQMRAILHGFWAWCCANEYDVRNPAENLLRAKEPPREAPPILTLPEIRRLLLADHDLTPYFAIGIFAGLRPTSELLLLRAEDFDWTHNEIIVKAHNAKTRVRRRVPMVPALQAWLRAYPPSEPIRYTKKAHKAAALIAAIAWTPDLMRHTCASYLLAAWQDAGKVAHVLGHRGVDVLYRHYANAVPAAEGKAFLEIMP